MIGDDAEPIAWLIMFKAPPARVSVVVRGPALLALASTMSALIFAVPPLMIRLPESVSVVSLLVRLAKFSAVPTLRTPDDAKSGVGTAERKQPANVAARASSEMSSQIQRLHVKRAGVKRHDAR